MSQTMLPNSAAAIPKTSAERASQPAAQPAPHGLAPGGDKEDEPGEEMARDARVWKTYVRETDRWDKEIVDERNSSLDVLLIFAALFSAISTSFIIVTLGDLKPASADLAVQTQQAILQALVQISNGQPVSPSAQGSNSAGFIVPRSAVVVNILWLLSLALSVGVSLIAMLAKGWCYQFMRGRSGQTYDQARRRQEKWEGIEKWKMQEVLEFLPWAMHLALLLFAAGMCVYLWNVHVAVAIPVIAGAGCVMFSYTLATLLPIVDRHCPYRTPLTPLLMWFLAHLLFTIAGGIEDLCVKYRWYRTASIFRAMRIFPYRYRTSRESGPAANSSSVSMDATTARMLAWLITSCDDSRSFDIALEGLAGARPGLPCLPLVSCMVHWELRYRLSACGKLHAQSENRAAHDKGKLLVALRYLRSYAALVSCDHESHAHLSATDVAALNGFLASDYPSRVIEDYKVIFQRSCEVFGEQEKAVWLAAASSSVLVAQIKHTIHQVNREVQSADSSHRNITVEPFCRAMQQHSIDITTLGDTGASLAYAFIRFLIQYEPSEREKQGTLYETLVQLCLAPSGTATRSSHMSALALAVAAFLLHTYPAGEEPPQLDHSDRCKRAMQVLHHYQSEEPNEPTTAALFAFGLVAVLPYLDPDASNIRTETWTRLQRLLLEGIYYLNHGMTIYTLPPIYSFNDHTNSLTESAASIQAQSDQPTEAVSWLTVLQNRVRPKTSDPVLYVRALAVLCCTHSVQVQALCMSILDSQPAALDVRHVVGQRYMYRYGADLTHELASADTSVVDAARFYLRLLAASIMLCPSVSLNERQSAFRGLCYAWGNDDQIQYDCMPTVDTILDHVTENVDQQTAPDSMRLTMQLIRDFCYTKHSSNVQDPACADWAERLHVIRCGRRPTVDPANAASELDATHKPPSIMEQQDDDGGRGEGTVPTPEVQEQDSTELNKEILVDDEAVQAA